MESIYVFISSHSQYSTLSHLRSHFNSYMQRIPYVNSSTCHNIKNKMIARFIKFRLLIDNKKKNRDTHQSVDYSSFTMSRKI